jgi:hypothetical protein
VTQPYLGSLTLVDHPRGRAEPEPDWRQNSELSSAWGEAAAAVPPAMAYRRRGMRVGGGGTGGGCVHSDGAYWFLQDQWNIYVGIIIVSIVIGVMRVFARLINKLYSTQAKNKKIGF